MKFKNHPFEPTDYSEVESLDEKVELVLPDDRIIDQYKVYPSRHPAMVCIQ